MLTIGERIRRYRRERGMKQIDLAKKIGINQCVISSWENEKSEPRLFYAMCISDAFGITLDELVGRTVAK